MSTLLDELIPTPRLLEVDRVDVAAPPERVFRHLRGANLARSAPLRALFELRALPERLTGKHEPVTLSIDELRSSPEKPGFSVLLEDSPHELAVGAIGKVWHAVIPFVHVPDATAFRDFDEIDHAKVAWSLRVLPLGQQDSRVELEVRVDATDDDAWRKFEAYFKLIGPGSHFIRRALLSGLAHDFGTPEQAEARRALPGDELLPVAGGEATDGVTIQASPESIWPWLLQMGCQRAGFYSYDRLDNGGARSSREVIPELQQLRVGDVIPATPDGPDGFEVLRLEAPHVLVLGGLYDVEAERQLAFDAPRPTHYWHATWAFVLERLNDRSTRLHVRARAAFPETEPFHAKWIRPVHHFMQHRMLRQLAARVEGRLPVNDLRDLMEGLGGAALMLVCLLTPFMRKARSHWGLERSEADRPRPGDELVPQPLWTWTHGVKVQASSELVWGWIAQVGCDRGGFYSYQWLENLAGCGLRNADAVHQDWELELGDPLLLHPKVPPLRIVQLERGRHFVAFAPEDPAARSRGEPWARASWLFQIEPLADGTSQLVTRYRAVCSPDLATRVALGPTFLESIGFAMDRRMLLGVKQRAERQAHYALTASRSSASMSSGTFTGLVK
jgi:hypothetical protein